MTKKIIVFGKNGQVGAELQQSLKKMGAVTSFDRNECDISNREDLLRVFNQESPDIVVNAAAYTNVDQAEDEKDASFLINANAPKEIAALCRENNAFLVHYSTDYVFDGSKSSPWLEEDQKGPLNIYGESKLQGELEIMGSGCNYVILRTSWVYSLKGANFLLTILRLASEKEKLKIVNDQIGAPTWSRTISENTVKVLDSIYQNKKERSTEEVFHFSSQGHTSWHGFTKSILNLIKHKRELKIKDFENDVMAIPSSEFPQKATRPKYSVMGCKKLSKQLGIEMPMWEDSLKECLEELE
jgi:dTDP-4-dehydrorhamnose reductase